MRMRLDMAKLATDVFRWHPQLRSEAGEQTPQGVSREYIDIRLLGILQGPMRRCFITSPVCRRLGTPKLVRETPRRHWWQHSKAGEKVPEAINRSTLK